METNQLQNKAQEWQAKSQETAQNVRSKAQEKLSDFKETAQDWKRRTTEASRKAARATDDYVHQSPWTVIASVAVAGLLLGLLLARSRD